MHDLIHNRAQSIVGYEVLIPRNAISHVSREVSIHFASALFTKDMFRIVKGFAPWILFDCF